MPSVVKLLSLVSKFHNVFALSIMWLFLIQSNRYLWNISSQNFLVWLNNEELFLIAFQSAQGWTTTARHGVTKREKDKGAQHTQNLIKINPKKRGAY